MCGAPTTRAAVLYGGGYYSDVFTVDQDDASGVILGYPAPGEGHISGLAFGPDKRLFASVVFGSGTPAELIEIDPVTGALIRDVGTITDTAAGPNGEVTGLKISDLSFQPGTGILFGITAGGGQVGGGLLYTIDTDTAEATLVGQTCAAPFSAAIAFAPDGTLYLTGQASPPQDAPSGGIDVLATVDPNTGECLTTVPVDNFYDALAVRPSDGKIFASIGDDTEVDTIDPMTGLSTFVGNAVDYVGDLDFMTVPQQLANVSTRASVGTGENVAIAGFIVQSDSTPGAGQLTEVPTAPSKRYLVRGIGTSLEAEPGMPLPGRLLDPVLKLYDENGELLAENDNWRDTQEGEIEGTGMAPTADAEAAMVVMLASDANYTAILSGKNNTSGIGLVEVFDLENGPQASSHLANISTRAFVSTNDDVLIGGTIIVGDEPIRLLVRAIGPSLAADGVANALQDPTLELHDANGDLVDSNDNWMDSPDITEIQASGLAPTNDKESAIVVSPDSAPYTAIVRGKDDTTGVGLVEAYRLPEPPPVNLETRRN